MSGRRPGPRNALSVADVRDVTVSIYLLVESDTGEVRYVGRSATPEVRLVHHRANGTPAVRAWVATLRQRSASVVLQIAAIVQPGDDSAIAEKLMIGQHIGRGARLLNVIGNYGDRERPSKTRAIPKNKGAAQLLAVNLTQATLAARIGANQSMISQWLTGRSKPDGVMRAVIEDTLGIYWRLWDQPVDQSSMAEAS